jgi:hypothetical protein
VEGLARLGLTSWFVVVVLLLSVSACFLSTTEAYYEDVRLLELSPSRGGVGTTVAVSLNVRAYFESKGESFPSSYGGLTYILAWDPLGEDNSLSAGALFFPRNLNKIGTSTIDFDGWLSGSAEIPWMSSSDYGVHNIYAIYESNSASSYKEWWWARFNVESGSMDTENFGIFVSVTGGGYVSKYPNQALYDYGSSVTLTAHPDDGWQFSAWGGDASGTSELATVYVTDSLYVTATFDKKSGGCFIATAAYGNPLSPEVSFMRNVRDNLIGSNDVGRTFVDAWNAFYYSWSPPVAYLIGSSNLLRTIVGVLLLPLLGLMHGVALQYGLLAPFSAEIASLVSFSTAAILASAIYIAFPIWAVYSLWKKGRTSNKSRHILADFAKKSFPK